PPALALRRTPRPSLFPYTTLFRSLLSSIHAFRVAGRPGILCGALSRDSRVGVCDMGQAPPRHHRALRPLSPQEPPAGAHFDARRSEEHTSELQSRENLVCRRLLEN